MKRLICLLLALGCLAALPGCRSHEERQEMRRQLDYASGRTEPASYEDSLSLNDGAVLPEQVLYEKNGVTITAMGIYEDEYSYCIPIRVRNERGMGTLYCYTASDSVTVDGWATDEDFWIDVIDGGMDDQIWHLGKSSLRYLEDGTIHQIEGCLSCDVGEDSFSVPVSLSLGNGTADLTQVPGTPVAEAGDCDLRYLERIRQDYYVTYLFCLVNNSSDDIQVNMGEDGLTVNGDMVLTDFYGPSRSVPAGAKALYEITLYGDDLWEFSMYDGDQEELYDEELEDAGQKRLDEIVSLDFILEAASERRGLTQIPVDLRLEDVS